ASHIIFSVSVAVQKYYGGMAARKCKQHEVRHFCKYHGRQREIEVEPTEEELAFSFFFFPSKPRRTSKDLYIEVFPGIYSVTAISEDMMQETHIVDVNAGQSIDLTFGL
ncbi:AKIP1 protein, partial [Climacteris rufus]|nr:AKIP1 protein [Climacteris rufus]